MVGVSLCFHPYLDWGLLVVVVKAVQLVPHAPWMLVAPCVLARVEVVGVRGCQSWVLMKLVRVVGQVVGEQQRSVEDVLSVPLAAAVVVDVAVGGVVAEGRLTCDVVTPC